MVGTAQEKMFILCFKCQRPNAMQSINQTINGFDNTSTAVSWQGEVRVGCIFKSRLPPVDLPCFPFD